MITYRLPVYQIKSGKTLKTRLDIRAFSTLISNLSLMQLEFAVLEDVGGRPGQSASAAFNFGRTCGQLEAVLSVLSIPIRVVSPSVWKRQMGVPSDKASARACATREFPDAAHQWRLAKDDGRAEAALLALWGSRARAIK